MTGGIDTGGQVIDNVKVLQLLATYLSLSDDAEIQ